MVISKTEYLMFLKHPAWLWLKKHDKSKLPKPDAALQAMFNAGHLFEKYAEQLYPDGIKLGFQNYEDYRNLPYKTEDAIRRGHQTIFQGRLEKNNITCIFDVLDKVGSNEYDLIEIKSSTRAKDEHELDLAFQLLVLESAGVKIRNINVVHVNRDFVRRGKVDPKKLTATTDITKKVRALETETKSNLRKAFEVANSSISPSMSPRHAAFGAVREWLDILRFIDGEKSSQHIYNIASPNPFALGQLEDLHIDQIKDIPDEFKLKPKQKWQVDANKSGKRHTDKKKIKEFLDTFKYPLYFLDYETLTGVIPPFEGLQPYTQLPFQYSLHILESPKAKLKHKEYLHTENSDPTIPLVKQLEKDIGSEGTILVWNESFEKSCNDLMGVMLPKNAWFLKSVNSRIKDLMIPFARGWFVDKEFMGSASLKKVLPALVDELSYHHLSVQEGQAAQSVWMETFLNGKNQEDKAKITKDLIEYCKLDTLAMVKILEVLQKVK